MELMYGYNFVFFSVVVLWVLPWKIYAVWLAARRGDKKWFVVLLLLNTLAILDIFYIFYVVKKTWREIIQLIRRTLGMR